MKAKISALILGIILLLPLTLAFAQTDGTGDSLPLESPPCDEILKNIDLKVKNYEILQPLHLETYQMLYVKTDTAAKQAKVLGYDTDEIEADLVELDILIGKFQTNFDTFIKNLKDTKKYACSEAADAMYAQSYIKTQKSLGEVKKITEEISQLYEDEIRQNLLGLSMIEKGNTNE